MTEEIERNSGSVPIMPPNEVSVNRITENITQKLDSAKKAEMHNPTKQRSRPASEGLKGWQDTSLPTSQRAASMTILGKFEKLPNEVLKMAENDDWDDWESASDNFINEELQHLKDSLVDEFKSMVSNSSEHAETINSNVPVSKDLALSMIEKRLETLQTNGQIDPSTAKEILKGLVKGSIPEPEAHNLPVSKDLALRIIANRLETMQKNGKIDPTSANSILKDLHPSDSTTTIMSHVPVDKKLAQELIAYRLNTMLQQGEIDATSAQEVLDRLHADATIDEHSLESGPQFNLLKSHLSSNNAAPISTGDEWDDWDSASDHFVDNELQKRDNALLSEFKSLLTPISEKESSSSSLPIDKNLALNIISKRLEDLQKNGKMNDATAKEILKDLNSNSSTVNVPINKELALKLIARRLEAHQSAGAIDADSAQSVLKDLSPHEETSTTNLPVDNGLSLEMIAYHLNTLLEKEEIDPERAQSLLESLSNDSDLHPEALEILHNPAIQGSQLRALNQQLGNETPAYDEWDDWDAVHPSMIEEHGSWDGQLESLAPEDLKFLLIPGIVNESNAALDTALEVIATRIDTLLSQGEISAEEATDLLEDLADDAEMGNKILERINDQENQLPQFNLLSKKLENMTAEQEIASEQFEQENAEFFSQPQINKESFSSYIDTSTQLFKTPELIDKTIQQSLERIGDLSNEGKIDGHTAKDLVEVLYKNPTTFKRISENIHPFYIDKNLVATIAAAHVETLSDEQLDNGISKMLKEALESGGEEIPLKSSGLSLEQLLDDLSSFESRFPNVDHNTLLSRAAEDSATTEELDQLLAEMQEDSHTIANQNIAEEALKTQRAASGADNNALLNRASDDLDQLLAEMQGDSHKMTNQNSAAGALRAQETPPETPIALSPRSSWVNDHLHEYFNENIPSRSTFEFLIRNSALLCQANTADVDNLISESLLYIVEFHQSDYLNDSKATKLINVLQTNPILEQRLNSNREISQALNDALIAVHQKQRLL